MEKTFEEKGVKRLLIISSLVWIVANFNHPVTPSHFKNLGLPDHTFGTSYAMMVFAIFIMAPIWGSIGDQGYRIPALALASFLYGFIQILFAYSRSLASIMLLRALAGAAASGFHVGLMSSIVDLTPKESRGQLMAKYSAIMSISQAAGFLIGGSLGYFPPKTVFTIQGISMITISLIIALSVENTNSSARSTSFKKPKFAWDLIKEARQSEGIFTDWIKTFLLISFFIGIAYSGYNNAFNYYLTAELNLKPIFNGAWKAAVGIVGLISNLTINIWLVKNKDSKKSLTFLLAFASTAAFLVYFNKSLLGFLIFSFLFFILYTIQVPILQGFAVEDRVGNVGLMSGIFNASKNLGEMIGASSAGFSYNISSKAPFLIGAIAALIAFLLSFYNRIKNKKY